MWFAECYRRPDTRAWLGLINPTAVPQSIEVEVFTTPRVRRTLVVPARDRIAVELGEWGVRGDCGVEVVCATGRPCAASLVLWDDHYRAANAAVPVMGCEDPHD